MGAVCTRTGVVPDAISVHEVESVAVVDIAVAVVVDSVVADLTAVDPCSGRQVGVREVHAGVDDRDDDAAAGCVLDGDGAVDVGVHRGSLVVSDHRDTVVLDVPLQALVGLGECCEVRLVGDLEREAVERLRITEGDGERAVTDCRCRLDTGQARQLVRHRGGGGKLGQCLFLERAQ